MIEQGHLFSDMKLNDKPLSQCEMVLETDNRNCRLYVDADPERSTFYASAVSFVSSGIEGDHWENEELRVDSVFELVAYFDGVRHMWFNKDPSRQWDGYLHYPNMEGLIAMLQKVREIELEICWDCDGAE